MASLLMKRFNKNKISHFRRRDQVQFIRLLKDLLANGFNLQEALLFMHQVGFLKKKIYQQVMKQLTAGATLADIFTSLNFSQLFVMQLALAQAHGNLLQTLTKMQEHFTALAKQREQCVKVLSYPIVLLVFLILAIGGIRYFLLPQLLLTQAVKAQSWSIILLKNSPYYFTSFLGILSSSCLLLWCIFRKKSKFQQAQFWTKLPIVQSFGQLYYAAFFAAEWGKLLSQGIDTYQVTQLFQALNQQSLLTELAEQIEQDLSNGRTFAQAIGTTRLFTKEFILIIEQGAVKGQLGSELLIYSELCWHRFFMKVEHWLNWLQPVVFLVIALLIVSIYLAILLPIYDGMGSFL